MHGTSLHQGANRHDPQRNSAPGPTRPNLRGDTAKIAGKTTFSGLPRPVAASWIQGKKIPIPYGTKCDSLKTLAFGTFLAATALTQTKDSRASFRAVVVSE
jgi:hypothetical protein